ncbi:MAG: Ppx/GppA phosphatase family protein [Actinomycetota bacterium]
MESRTLAAVDVGTNSVHVVVARVHGHDTDVHFEILTRSKEMVRLGAGAGDMKELSTEAIDRAVAALARCRAIAAGERAELRVVATSAVREALNRDELLDRAEEAGVRVEVITGAEEARLIHLGVLQSVPAYDRRMLVVDIGGGSTELVIADGDDLRVARSLKLGAIRMTTRFFGGTILHPGAMDAARRHVRASLTPFLNAARDEEFDLAIGSSGTIEALAAIELARTGEALPRTMGNQRLTSAGLAETVGRLEAAARAGVVAELDGLEEKRADIILGGAVVLQGVLDALEVDEMTVSDTALREGVLLDTVLRTEGGTLDHLADLRRRSVEHLLVDCDDDPAHARHVGALAIDLFDATADLHGLGGRERELLEAGALLANVGLVVSHDRHHHHSYYVIRNSDRLSGFTDDEVELIALVARYHRKSAPKQTHEPFAQLSEADQHVVRVLAGILRVAVSLDRSRQQAIRSIGAEWDAKRLRVSCRYEPDSDVELDLYTAGQRTSLLSRCVDRRVKLTATAT